MESQAFLYAGGQQGNNVLYGLCKVTHIKSMTYRENKKALMRRSRLGVEARARNRLDNAEYNEPCDIDHYMKITVERRGTSELVVFELFEGNRIDNYTVICNGEYQGIQSISTLTKNIRKSLPRFRRMN